MVKTKPKQKKTDAKIKEYYLDNPDIGAITIILNYVVCFGFGRA